MLFTTKITQIQGTIANITTEIDDLQRRIELLREQKLSLESHLQQLGSAESAAESALEQVKTALHMIHAISPSEVTTFKSAIDHLFSQPFEPLPELPEAAVTPEPEPEPQPSPETDPDAGAQRVFDIEVQASAIPESTIETETAEETVLNLAPERTAEIAPAGGATAPSTNGNGNGHYSAEDLKTLLKSKHMNDLRKLLDNRNLPTNGNKNTLIERLVDSDVTPAELL